MDPIVPKDSPPYHLSILIIVLCHQLFWYPNMKECPLLYWLFCYQFLEFTSPPHSTSVPLMLESKYPVFISPQFGLTSFTFEKVSALRLCSLFILTALSLNSFPQFLQLIIAPIVAVMSAAPFIVSYSVYLVHLILIWMQFNLVKAQALPSIKQLTTFFARIFGFLFFRYRSGERLVLVVCIKWNEPRWYQR